MTKVTQSMLMWHSFIAIILMLFSSSPKVEYYVPPPVLMREEKRFHTKGPSAGKMIAILDPI